ncbi:hypothetical protein GTX53_09500 [Streptomyces sp. SID5594]|uniref:hypothetical protein n=1 Tax=unclassified Streptomyces TaxID=2593676 RepID=UPI0003805CE6|nr:MULTISPECIES: hypothetical protein [unclassified Streptomyces]MZF54075.1 hypothetical protein [Streptomyces sp. SID5594]PVC83882.1 hypothetical protein DBP19_32735 [Streptomyces sp. CS090A]
MTTRTPGSDTRARGHTRWWGNPRVSRAAGRTAEGLRRLADRLDQAVHRDGYAGGAVRGPGARGAAGPDAPGPAAALPVAPPEGAPSPAAPPVTPPDCVAVARDVLAVADRLRNEELARRLFDAVGRLPGLRVLRPAPGDAFEPAEHQWDETRPTDDPAREETVAALLAPGFSGPQNELIRTARVAVYATEVK